MAAKLYRRPVSVLVVVYTERGDVLLLRRIKPFDFWQSITGSLNDGESVADAARRELHEETGLSDAGTLSYAGIVRHFDIDPRWRYRFPPGVVQNREHEWRYRLTDCIDIQMDAEEHSEYRWCPIDAAIDCVWSWTNREALEGLRASL